MRRAGQGRMRVARLGAGDRLGGYYVVITLLRPEDGRAVFYTGPPGAGSLPGQSDGRTAGPEGESMFSGMPTRHTRSRGSLGRWGSRCSWETRMERLCKRWIHDSWAQTHIWAGAIHSDGGYENVNNGLGRQCWTQAQGTPKLCCRWEECDSVTAASVGREIEEKIKSKGVSKATWGDCFKKRKILSVEWG